MEPVVEPAKPDTECAICQTDLGLAAFVKGHKEDSEESETVFRLNCGHAFHTTCLCRSLRCEDTSCPSCRSKKSETEREFRFSVGQDGNIVITLPQDSAEDEPEFIAGVRDIYAINTVLDKNDGIQVMRARANRAHKRYREAELSIVKRRRSLVDGALRRLRDETRDTFNKEKRIYLNSLRLLRNKEKDIALKYIEDHDLNDVKDDIIEMINDSTDIKTRAHNSFGPLKTRFWTHG